MNAILELNQNFEVSQALAEDINNYLPLRGLESQESKNILVEKISHLYSGTDLRNFKDYLYNFSKTQSGRQKLKVLELSAALYNKIS